MTSPTPAPVTPEEARTVAGWAGLPAGAKDPAELAAILSAFRARVERLHAIDAADVEFDFLRPMD